MREPISAQQASLRKEAFRATLERSLVRPVRIDSVAIHDHYAPRQDRNIFKAHFATQKV